MCVYDLLISLIVFTYRSKSGQIYVTEAASLEKHARITFFFLSVSCKISRRTTRKMYKKKQRRKHAELFYEYICVCVYLLSFTFLFLSFTLSFRFLPIYGFLPSFRSVSQPFLGPALLNGASPFFSRKCEGDGAGWSLREWSLLFRDWSRMRGQGLSQPARGSQLQQRGRISPVTQDVKRTR